MTHENSGIIDFNAKRGVRSEDFADIGDYAAAKAEENAAFCGKALNSENLDRLNTIRDCCAKIAELDADVRFINFPPDSRERNGIMQINVPGLYMAFDKRITRLFSRIFAEADDFGVVETDDGLNFTFGVRDIWDD